MASADVAQNIYNLKRSFIPKREANIQLGMTLTRAALIALSARYEKELSRRTGTKTFTFNNEQLRKKEKYLKEHGGMNRIQEHFYDKRNNK